MVDGKFGNAGVGDYLHVPPGHEMRIKGKDGQATIFIHKQRYRSHEDVVPNLLWGNADEKAAAYTDGAHSQTLKKLLGDSADYDMAANILGFEPGVGFNQVETHAEEHGIYVMAGQACFMLDKKWIMVREGDYYRIAHYAENHYYDCYEVVAKDKSEALVTYVQVLNRPSHHSRRIRIPGLDLTAVYVIENAQDWPEIRQTEYRGDALQFAGINVPPLWGDFKGRLLHLVRK